MTVIDVIDDRRASLTKTDSGPWCERKISTEYSQ